MEDAVACRDEQVRLGRWLRHLRVHHKLKQAEVAAVLGKLDQSVISRLEEGNYNLSFRDYVRLCQFGAGIAATCDDPHCVPPLQIAQLQGASRTLRSQARALALQADAVRQATIVLREQQAALRQEYRRLRMALVAQHGAAPGSL